MEVELTQARERIEQEAATHKHIEATEQGHLEQLASVSRRHEVALATLASGEGEQRKQREQLDELQSEHTELAKALQRRESYGTARRSGKIGSSKGAKSGRSRKSSSQSPKRSSKDKGGRYTTSRSRNGASHYGSASASASDMSEQSEKADRYHHHGNFSGGAYATRWSVVVAPGCLTVFVRPPISAQGRGVWHASLPVVGSVPL